MKHSHLRGLKLLFCATLALAIVLSLLPAQEAKALKQGQTCPDCGTGILIPISYNSEQHALSCSKTGCIHSSSAGYIWENHHGGNACTGRPICEGCGQEYGSALGHDWQTEWTIDGDAHYHACSRCTERKDEAAHNYVWTYVDDDTCKGVCECGAEITEAHYDRWASSCGRQPHCEKCDHDYGTIPEHEMWYEDRGESGHKPSCYHCDTYFFLEPHVGTSTCTEAGTCSLCGGTIPALGHDWATTLTNGGDTHYYACSRCDAKKDEAAHTYNWTYVDDSTHKGTCACGAETTEVHYDRWADKCGRQPHCEKCDTDYGTPPEHEMIYEDRGESGHKPSCKHCDTYFFLEPHVGTSTCTETGTCSLCGGTIPALGHDWATTLTNGGDTHYYACSRCDAKKDEAAHSYGDWTPGTKDHWRTCECGAMDIEAHYNDGMMNLDSEGHGNICHVCTSSPLGWIYNIEPHTFGDWTDNGDGTHTGKCVCGAEKTEDHSGGTATCTAKAVCANCGQEYGESKGHDWATTLTNGGDTHYYACSRCDAKKDEAAHIYENWTKVDDSNHKGKCACGKEKTEPHSGGTATCQAKAKCANCGEEYGDTLGHDMKKTDKVEPTCTTPGTEAYWTCQRENCGKLFSDDQGENEINAPVTIKALGHDPKKTDKVEPTCTTPGTEAYWTCQRDNCGKLFSDDQGENEINAPVTIKALGHDLIHHDAKAPTCTAIGWDAYDTCSRCDYSTYVEKAKLGHDLIHHNAQAPTCTEIGWDAYDTCSRCNYSTYVQKSALGHDLIHHDAQAPTCTAIGWDAYDTCSRCNYSTYVEKSAVGHDYQITSRTITIITSRCSHCGDSEWWYNPNSRNLVDGLVRDGEGAPVDYSAGVSRVNGKRVLTVTPDLADGEAGLYLTPEEAELWLKQGIDTVSFSTDFAALEIDLSTITAEWFPLEDGAEIDFFIFTLAPAENGAEVRVEALIGEEKTPAEAFTGIALFLEDQEINVTENGVYRKE